MRDLLSRFKRLRALAEECLSSDDDNDAPTVGATRDEHGRCVLTPVCDAAAGSGTHQPSSSRTRRLQPQSPKTRPEQALGRTSVVRDAARRVGRTVAEARALAETDLLVVLTTSRIHPILHGSLRVRHIYVS